MQAIIFAKISKSDLAYLLGVGITRIDAWITEGLPVIDNRIPLAKALQWLRAKLTEEAQQKFMMSRVTQKDLAKLAGVSRQTLSKWVKAGLPANADKSYDLKKVMHWLREYYNESYRKKHQRLARTMRKFINEYQKKKILVDGDNAADVSYLSLCQSDMSPFSINSMGGSASASPRR